MKKNLLLSTTGLVLCLSLVTLFSAPAQAQQEMGSLVYYDVPASEYTENYSAWRLFLEYHLHREQCQNYVAPPQGYVMKGCQVYRIGSVADTRMETTRVTETESTTVTSPAVTAESYTIHFGFDKSNVTESEGKVLDNVARDVRKYNPSDVMVSGYASTPGSSEYNQALSERRAESVVQELERRGVRASVIGQAAYGETHLAVPTADNVKMPPNRRVVIKFKY